jgi:hypothetical protein
MRWRRFARGGQYAKALVAARRAGLSRLLRRSSSSDLLLLADAARLGGNVDMAEKVLKTVRRRFGKKKAARQAAYRLGRLMMEKRRNTATRRAGLASIAKRLRAARCSAPPWDSRWSP